MNRVDLSKEIAANLEYQSGDVLKVLKELQVVVEGALVRGDTVKLGFVSMKPVTMAARPRRNPKTGDPIACPAYTAVKVKASPALKAGVKEALKPTKAKK